MQRKWLVLSIVLVLLFNTNAADISSCGAITEDSALTQNIFTTASCLEFNGQNNLVLDGKGYSIIGDAGATDYAIFTTGNNLNITVKNLVVRNFSRGVSLQVNSHNWSVVNNTFENTSSEGILVNGNDHNFSYNAFKNSQDNGIRVSSGSNLELAYNTFSVILNGNGYGIYLQLAGNGSLIYNNTFVQSSQGTRLEGVDNVSIIKNTFFSNNFGNGVGVHLFNTANSLISNNLFFDNANWGLKLTTSHANTIRNNTFYAQGVYSLSLNSSNNTLIEGNTFNDSGITSGPPLFNITYSPISITGVDGISRNCDQEIYLEGDEDSFQVTNTTLALPLFVNGVIAFDVACLDFSGDEGSDNGTYYISTGQGYDNCDDLISDGFIAGGTNNDCYGFVNNYLVPQGSQDYLVNSSATPTDGTSLSLSPSGTSPLALQFKGENLSSSYGIVIENSCATTFKDNEFYNSSIFGMNQCTQKMVRNNTFGSITWPALTNLTTHTQLVLGKTVFISNNLIGLADSPYLSNLNVSATINFKGLLYDTPPLLMRNGVRCDHLDICNISYDNDSKILTANIGSFSNYSTQANSAPTINNLAFSPGSAYGNTTLNASFTYNDADQDTGTVTFQWIVAGVNVFNQTFTQVADGTVISSKLLAGNHSRSQDVNLTVSVSDGSVTNSSVTSLTVLNTVPVLGNFSNQSVTSGDIFVYNITCTDSVDNDALTYYDNTTLFDINSSSGSITDSPLSSEAGLYSINITCSDNTDNISQILNYVITAAPSSGGSSASPGGSSGGGGSGGGSCPIGTKLIRGKCVKSIVEESSETETIEKTLQNILDEENTLVNTAREETTLNFSNTLTGAAIAGLEEIKNPNKIFLVLASVLGITSIILIIRKAH